MISRNKTQKGTEDNLVNTSDELTRYNLIERYYSENPNRKTPKNIDYLNKVKFRRELLMNPNAKVQRSIFSGHAWEGQ